MKSPKPAPKKQSVPFQSFVEKIAAVPKAEADKIEAERPKTKKRWRQRPAKAKP